MQNDNNNSKSEQEDIVEIISDRSKIEPSLMCKPNTWVLSIVRKDKSGNPEHASLILEGIEEGILIVKKYDLYAGEGYKEGDSFPKQVFDQSSGKVSSTIIEKQIKGNIEQVKAWFKENVHNRGKVYYRAWNISDEQAERLQEDIAKDIGNPPPYNMIGHRHISGASSIGAHSCYTWARDKINKLGDKNVTLPPKFEEFIKPAYTSKRLG